MKEAERMTSKKSIVALQKGMLGVTWVPWLIFSISWCWSSDRCAAEWYDAGRYVIRTVSVGEFGREIL